MGQCTRRLITHGYSIFDKWYTHWTQLVFLLKTLLIAHYLLYFNSSYDNHCFTEHTYMYVQYFSRKYVPCTALAISEIAISFTTGRSPSASGKRISEPYSENSWTKLFRSVAVALLHKLHSKPGLSSTIKRETSYSMSASARASQLVTVGRLPLHLNEATNRLYAWLSHSHSYRSALYLPRSWTERETERERLFACVWVCEGTRSYE